MTRVHSHLHVYTAIPQIIIQNVIIRAVKYGSNQRTTSIVCDSTRATTLNLHWQQLAAPGTSVGIRGGFRQGQCSDGINHCFCAWLQGPHKVLTACGALLLPAMFAVRCALSLSLYVSACVRREELSRCLSLSVSLAPLSLHRNVFFRPPFTVHSSVIFFC